VLVSGVAVLALVAGAMGGWYGSVLHDTNTRLHAALDDARQARRVEAESNEQKEVNLYFHRMVLAEREWRANNVARAEGLLEDCPPGLRGWEWHYLRPSATPSCAP
jgi:hypothetical protein